jgi:hypothetical protein
MKSEQEVSAEHNLALLNDDRHVKIRSAQMSLEEAHGIKLYSAVGIC